MFEPFWHAELTPRPTLAEPPHHADVVVVGGGLSGAWLALALAEAGRPPVVLERAHVAAGASGRNGGLLLPGTAELYPALIARHGPEAAHDLWAWALAGAADVVDAIARHGIACDWRPEGALHVAVSAHEAASLEAAAARLAADGFPGAWLPAPALDAWLDVDRPRDVHGALHMAGGGGFHSGRLVVGLATAAAGRGAAFVEGIDVRSIAAPDGDGPLVVHTDRGPIKAEVVIVATNAWLSELLPGLAAAVVPVRGQVLATAPLAARVIRGAWSLNDGYEYLQQLSDGRLVLGGLRWLAPDREVGRVAPDVSPAIHAGLDGWLAAHFPTLAVTVARRWAGPMCWTADRLPLVGPVTRRLMGPAEASKGRRPTGAEPSPDDDAAARLWVAAAYSGHGVPIAPAAARLVAAALTGGTPSPVAGLVDPRRPLAAVVTAAPP